MSSTTTDLSSVDLTELDLFVDGPPHALFARMRRQAPVCWNPSADGVGFWSITAAEDVTYVSNNPETFSSARGGILLRPDSVAPLDVARNWVLYKDPPDHAKYRSIVAHVFLARTMVLLDEIIHDIVTETLDKVVARGECDLVRDVAVPIPLLVIGRLLGSPDEDMHKLLGWTDEIENAITHHIDVTESMRKMAAHLLALVDNQIVEDVDSLAGELATAEVDGKRLTEEEIATYFAIMLYSGNAPSRSAISGGMLALMENPAQLELLRNEPTRLRCRRSSISTVALDEILRWVCPINLYARTATKDTQIRDVEIRAGERVVMWYASASRDSHLLPQADTFDITRASNPPHFAFGGGGPHFCQGDRLVHWVLSITLQEVIKRLPDIKVAGPVTRLRSVYANSLTSLPVTFTPTR